VVFVPETGVRKDFVNEIPSHAASCITMQALRNHQGRFSGIGTGKGAGNGPQAAETR